MTAEAVIRSLTTPARHEVTPRLRFSVAAVTKALLVADAASLALDADREAVATLAKELSVIAGFLTSMASFAVRLRMTGATALPVSEIPLAAAESEIRPPSVPAHPIAVVVG